MSLSKYRSHNYAVVHRVYIVVKLCDFQTMSNTCTRLNPTWTHSFPTFFFTALDAEKGCLRFVTAFKFRHINAHQPPLMSDLNDYCKHMYPQTLANFVTACKLQSL